MGLATKIGRALTQHEGVSPIKLHDPLITWSRDKLERLYLHHRNVRSNRTEQRDDFW